MIAPMVIEHLSAATADLAHANDRAAELDALRFELVWIEAQIDDAVVDKRYYRSADSTELSSHVRRLSQDWIRVASHILRLSDGLYDVEPVRDPEFDDDPVPVNDDYFVWHKDDDPSPWCSGCGAMTAKRCKCGPIADNN